MSKERQVFLTEFPAEIKSEEEKQREAEALNRRALLYRQEQKIKSIRIKPRRKRLPKGWSRIEVRTTPKGLTDFLKTSGKLALFQMFYLGISVTVFSIRFLRKIF